MWAQTSFDTSLDDIFAAADTGYLTEDVHSVADNARPLEPVSAAAASASATDFVIGHKDLFLLLLIRGWFRHPPDHHARYRQNGRRKHDVSCR